MAITRAKIKQGMMLMRTICDAVRVAGEIPSGHLYAQLMGVCTLAAYESLLRQVTATGLISQRGQLLVWTGPKE